MRGRARKKKPAIAVIGCLDRVPDAIVQSGHRSEVAGNVLLSGPDPLPAHALATSLLTGQGIRIVQVHGTNGKVEVKDIDAAEKRIARCDMMLLLLNVEIGAIIHAAGLAKKHHIQVILDPVPMMSFPEKIRRTAELIGSVSHRFLKNRSKVIPYRRKNG
ncbi:hypothetical protein [Sporolactobacillus sp. KGMB 08714]|uniref:hypothetical protein n=1 Tax=Sporolactobacillus sp. KGMB 08714 TaxID=3064704 RepID=UPI002FBD6510